MSSHQLTVENLRQRSATEKGVTWFGGFLNTIGTDWRFRTLTYASAVVLLVPSAVILDLAGVPTVTIMILLTMMLPVLAVGVYLVRNATMMSHQSAQRFAVRAWQRSPEDLDAPLGADSEAALLIKRCAEEISRFYGVSLEQAMRMMTAGLWKPGGGGQLVEEESGKQSTPTD